MACLIRTCAQQKENGDAGSGSSLGNSPAPDNSQQHESTDKPSSPNSSPWQQRSFVFQGVSLRSQQPRKGDSFLSRSRSIPDKAALNPTSSGSLVYPASPQPKSILAYHNARLLTIEQGARELQGRLHLRYLEAALIILY